MKNHYGLSKLYHHRRREGLPKHHAKEIPDDVIQNLYQKVWGELNDNTDAK